MLPASNRGVGMNIGFPDVCLTPPVPEPVPYPNLALNVMAVPFSPNILLTMMPALNLISEIPMTMGDEAGIAHPIIMGPGSYMMGNPKVLLNGLPAITLACPTRGNEFNDPLGAVLVPSVTNVFFTHAASAGADPTPEALRALAASLSRDGRAVDARMLAAGIGYVRVRVFSRDVPARVFTALRRLEAEGLEALVVDVRDNPGGELDAAVDLAGDFLAPGSVVVTIRDQDGDETTLRSRRRTAYRWPLVILADRGTASAAELFAGSLQAHRRAVVAGETTFGKGTGRAFAPALGGGLGTVAASFTLPGGAALDGAGVRPDVAARSPAPGQGALGDGPEPPHQIGQELERELLEALALAVVQREHEDRHPQP